MNCPFCKQSDTRVIDTRLTEAGLAIRRRRQCAKCGKRFTTYEKAETTIKLMVIKKDNTREPYDRNKIITGLEKACYKRPVSGDQLEQLVDKIEEKLSAENTREVHGRTIGQLVMAALKEIDDIAYVRFASIYHEFRDVGEFIDEATEVINRRKKEMSGQGKLFDQNSKKEQ